MSKFFSAMSLALILGAGYAAASPGLPEYYPDYYDQIGTLNGINTQDKFIVINDMTNPIAIDLKVHTPTTRFGTLRSLRPGMRVGTTTIGETGQRRVVTDIWVLPADYSPE